jgi:hypothetical protein
MKRINFQKFKIEERKAMKNYVSFGESVFLKALKEQAENYQNFIPEIMEEAYLRFYERVFVDSAKRGLKYVRVINQKAFIDDAFFLTSWRAWIRDYVFNDIVIRKLITQVNDRTLKEIAKALSEGIELGLTGGQLTDSIINFVGKRSRARGIAITEATRANAIGKERSADDWQKETGSELWKLWIHSGNPREPRNNHIQLQNKPIPKDQLFDNGLDKPGDANGSASETVNCRCTIVYVSRDYVSEYFPSFINGNSPVNILTTDNTIIENTENQRIKDELFLTNFDSKISSEVKDILQNSDGSSDLMNQNNSLFTLRTERESTINGTIKFAQKFLGDAWKAKKIGVLQKSANGNCARDGSFLNIKAKKGDFVDFKKIQLGLNKYNVDEMVNTGSHRIGIAVGGKPILIEKASNEILGFINKDGSILPWSVSSVMKKGLKRNLAPTITHESAHMIQANKDKGFLKWNQSLYRNKLSPSKDSVTEYGKTNVQELFAETYAAFVYDNEGLKLKNKLLYDVFVEYLSSIGVDINTIKIAK